MWHPGESPGVRRCVMRDVCMCAVVQMWGRGRDVSAPLKSPDVYGKSVHM